MPRKVASGAVLQMNQAAFADKGLLWHILQCGENSNLDRDIGLRPRGHLQEEIWLGAQPLHNSTDLERNPFRENPYFAGIQ